MNARISCLAGCLATASLAGCLKGDEAVPTARLDIQVAPLLLPAIGNAQYTIVVANSSAQTVWSQTVTSDQYGDGVGSISYVGPCDAQANPHSVTLTLDYLWDSNTVELASPKDYQNPGPITLYDVACKENADVPVVFNLTIMRAAVQGFFDVAVNFQDVFCSAKVDCKPQLLNDGDTRGPTVVMGYACTSGQGRNGPESTWMYLSEVTLTCVDAVVGGPLPTLSETLEISEVVAPGMQGPTGLLFNWAQYQGMEEFGDIDKCYWNHAFGLDLDAIGARVCTLTGTATASNAPLFEGNIATDVVWPVINFSVDVVKAGQSLCDPNPLNGDPSGVTTSYVTPNSTPRPAAFAAAYHCGGTPTPVGFACQGSSNAFFQPTTVGANAAVEVVVGGVSTAAPYVLPAGATLAGDCCLDRCCQQAQP